LWLIPYSAGGFDCCNFFELTDEQFIRWMQAIALLLVMSFNHWPDDSKIKVTPKAEELMKKYIAFHQEHVPFAD